jgi:hypothetical protein
MKCVRSPTVRADSIIAAIDCTPRDCWRGTRLTTASDT